jgi:hypothetical protein
MTTSFADYAMQQDAKNTIYLNIIKYCYELIDALKANHVMRFNNVSVDFEIESGKKYHKIVMISSGNARSVHAFVDKNTGDLYKAASWKSPAKGVRFNLLLIKDREWLMQYADSLGGYLYRRG